MITNLLGPSLLSPGKQPEKLSEDVTPEPQKPASSETAKQKEEEILYGCKKDKLMIPKLLGPSLLPPDKQPEKIAEDVTPEPQKLVSFKTDKQKKEKIACGCQKDKQEKVKIICDCNKDKVMENDLEGQRSRNKKSRLHSIIRKSISTIKNKVGQLAPGKLITQSPKSGEPKEEAMTCKCKNNGKKEGNIICECKNKGKKEGEIICECKHQGKPKEGDIICDCKKDKPSPKETKAIGSVMSPQKRCFLQLPPPLLGLPPLQTPEGFVYEGIGPSCQWVDTGEIRKLRSQMTRSFSGFKVSKMKKQELQTKAAEHVELDFGEAIRYFARMNPERFHQLMQEELERQLEAEQKKIEGKEGENLKKQLEKEKHKIEKAQRTSDKKAGKGKITKATVPDHPETDLSEHKECSDEPESPYPLGFKFSIPIKDYPNTFARLDCIEKIQKQFFKTKRHR